MHIAHEEELNFSSQNMFDMVLDIEAYPDFVPYCTTMHILSRNTQTNEIIACMGIGYGFIRENIECLITSDQKQSTITITYLNGLLSSLHVEWRFISLSSTQSLCQFNLNYQCRSPLKRKIIDSFIAHFFDDFIAIFKKRAKMLYGNHHYISSS